MTHHDLKVGIGPWGALRDGRKTFEARKNDRDYQVGDTLTLRAFEERLEGYMPETIYERLHYRVLDVQSRFMADGYVGLSLRRLRKAPGGIQEVPGGR